MYPVEKYHFYVSEKQHMVVAVSTYAGKTVKGYAKCDPRDEFDIEAGKKLAAARCAEKIANKRAARAQKKIVEAQRLLDEARVHYQKMTDYYNDSQREAAEATRHASVMAENM